LQGIQTGFGWVTNHLNDAIAIAQVDKGYATMIALAMDPTGQGDGLPYVGGAQFAASVSFIHTESP
jgi:hypothetical protein